MKAFFISAAILILLSSGAEAQTIGDTIISNNIQNLKLKVYYFHVTDRCNTCYSIEKNIKKVLFENYQEELNKGIIDLYVLNCELPKNKDLVEKFSAYGSTTAISVYEYGKEIAIEDLSSWAFKKIYNPELFAKELKEKINSLIQ